MHKHFDIDTAVAQVHKTFEEMRSLPNVGRHEDEANAIDNQLRPEAEALRVAFTRYYLTLINEGAHNQMQAHSVGVVLADCVLDWITGYDIGADLRPVQHVMGAFCEQVQSGVNATLQGDMGAASNPIEAMQAGNA